MNICKSYSELIQIDDYEDRFDYLNLNGVVGDPTFGAKRYLNQVLYKSPKWKSLRREIIFRDNGCDLGHKDYMIYGPIYIHHINPITVDDILEERSCVFDPNNLISTTFQTHNAIHYGEKSLIFNGFSEREKNDTCPWRK